MEIRDVVTIQSLEEYLKERNFKVNAYEEDVLQAIWPFLRDRQLFFLIKILIIQMILNGYGIAFMKKLKESILSIMHQVF